jgi:hypothetical protein
MTVTDQAHVDLAIPGGPMRTYGSLPTAPGRYPGFHLFSGIFQVTGPIRRRSS